MKRQPTEWEKILTEWEKILTNRVSDKRLVLRIHRKSYSSIQKTQTNWLKLGKGYKQTFLKIGYTNNQVVHENVLNSISH